MDFFSKFFETSMIMLAIIGIVIFLIFRGNKKDKEDKLADLNRAKEVKLVKIKEFEESLRTSEEYKRRKEAALQMLTLLLSEKKAREIMSSVENNLNYLYDEACIADDDGYNYLLSMSWESVNETEFFLSYLRKEYFKDHYIENFSTKSYALASLEYLDTMYMNMKQTIQKYEDTEHLNQEHKSMELEILDDSFILKGALPDNSDMALELSNHFNSKFFKDMAKILGYDNLVFPSKLDESLKNALELKDYAESILPYLKPYGYLPIFFRSPDNDINYKYTIIPEVKYDLMKKLLEETGYITAEPLNESVKT